MSSPESLTPVSAEKKKNPILDALESAGVRLQTRQNEIRREIGKCELAIQALLADAPRDEKGDVASGAKKQLEQDFSYAIRESEERILQMINKSRQAEPLTEVPAVIADKLGRFSTTEDEVAELARVREEILKSQKRIKLADSNSGASDPSAPKSDAPFLDKIRAMSPKLARESGVAADKKSSEKPKGGKAPVANSSPVRDNGKHMSAEGLPKPNSGAEGKDKEKAALVSMGPFKFEQRDVDEILKGIDYNRARRGRIVRESGGVEKMSEEAKRDFEKSYQGARRSILRMAQQANKTDRQMRELPSAWEERLNGYDVPLESERPISKNADITRMNKERGQFEGEAADFVQYGPEDAEVSVAPASKARPGVLDEVAGAVNKDLGGEEKKGGGKKRKDSGAQTPVATGESGADSVSSRLEKAKKWKEELEQGKKTEKAAEAQPLKPESAIDNPDFQRFMLAYFPDGDAGEAGPERLTAHIEMFNRFQETVGQTADIFIELLERDGVVKVSPETRKEFIEDIGSFMLKNARNQPLLLEGLQTSIRNLNEAQPRIAEKEAQLASLGSRDALVAERDELAKGSQQKKALEADYGKGPVRSFVRGFVANFNKKIEVSGAGVQVVGEMGELGLTPIKTEKRPGFFKRLVSGWKGGVEAKVKSEAASSELKSAGLAKIEEALSEGMLQKLEDKIRTLEDADREKKRMTVAFDQARELIFEGIGQLSGVTNRIKEMAQKQIQMMRTGEGGLDSLQDSYERLVKARERLTGDGDIGYVPEKTVEAALSEVDDFIKLEFMERIQGAMTTAATGESAYDAMRESLGKYARLEKLGSKHGAEVKELFRDTVKILSKREGVTNEQRLRMSFFLGALNADQAPTEHPAEAAAAEHAVEAEAHGEAAHHAEVKSEEVKVPKVGDKITFYGNVDGEEGLKTFKDFEVKSFKYKGEKPSPDAILKVEGMITDKKGKSDKRSFTLRYGDYVKSQTKAEKAH